ncbi:hypothetical protein DVH26_35380 [Paenibacillus sp. H1-7]|uniref:YwmB family TATA-box binding protein n=1 Tax=Paenibacillus sp. H1-7 TaxID=2282849 RepID=UPI001EF84507|nr:YwmB family TATA-box binding protein [Paenibacillus sp. H1-7]ULL19240.1 hypothetical protein DVH26_35380 [Paenibacillus sp. H1-7]
MRRIALAYGICAIIALGAWIGGWAAHADAGREAALGLLLPVSSEVMSAGNPKIVMKHTSTYIPYENKEQLLRTGQSLSQTLGLPASQAMIEDGDHLLYKSASTDARSGIETTLLWIGFGDGTTELIVSSQTEGTAGAEEAMIRAQRELDGKLLALDIKPQWNIMIQGELSDSGADPERLLNTLSRQLQGQEVERYEDRGSTSVTYYSPALQERVSNGKHAMNVQIAVHRDSVTGKQRMTIGVPAISIEY